jgi:voltage-gated potassium channel
LPAFGAPTGGRSSGGGLREPSSFQDGVPRVEASALWRRAGYTAAALPLLLLAGALAYVVVEGWSFSDGLYMTAITISTAGYREVHSLSEGGRLVTYGVLLGGISWLAFLFATVTAFFIESDVFHVFRRRRMDREISVLEDHFIVCGAGRTGTQAIAEFLRSGASYVAIDADEERVTALLREAPHLRLLHGDTTRDEMLMRANIGRARGLIAALSDDASNLFLTVSARALNPELTIVARVSDDDNAAKLYRAGADHVVSPQRIGGVRMASLLLRPGVMSLLDVMTRGGGVTLSIEELQLASESGLGGKTLNEIEIPQRTGALVVAIRKNEPRAAQPFLFNPNSGTRVEAGDTLIVMGERNQIEALQTLVQPRGKA